MAMKNAKNVNFWQENNKIEKISGGNGFIILPISEAFEKFDFLKNHFKKKPKQGFFAWVKKSVDCPLISCILISSINVFQSPENFIILEKNVNAKMHSLCYSIKKILKGKHKGSSKIFLKENSKLSIKHYHNWGGRDVVISDLKIFLGKGAKLSYSFKCLKAPEKLETKSNFYLKDKASVNSVFTVFAKNSNIKMYDSTFLNGKKSSGISRIRMIGDKKSKIFGRSQIIANNSGTGHVDCLGLLLAEKSTIQAVPELINKNKDALLTHEASVGKISKKILNYLRTRGLTEDRAIDLIITSFLGKEEPVIVKGQEIKSEFFM
jgi:Fe-S cluster assembly scaffold protein SufB